ncbi:MAG: phosphopantetheine-binding protein [Anaerolineales bacterium]|jgi:acyl carrier protein|nr:phosphopantetheine-binding protein [Anaerolineales bacterium]
MQDQIAAFISAELIKDPTRKIAFDEALISSGLVDSFSLVDLALFIEETFSTRIDDTELTAEVFDTIEELVAIISARRTS